ncbi:MAG: metal transporter [Flavobacterium sp.]|nr:metal transporter [Flavobacterium sp.]
MKKLMLFVILLGWTALAQSQVKNKNAKYTFEVNGNCDQCQKRIQKAAFSVSGVKMAMWDIESHQMTVLINEEKCEIVAVKQAIARVGHDTDQVKATDDAYQNLHSCCLYERVK